MSYITNTPSLHVIVCHLAHKLTHQTSVDRFGYGLGEQVGGQVDTLDPRGTHPSRFDEVSHEVISSVNNLPPCEEGDYLRAQVRAHPASGLVTP